jgi:hypothetical protein
MFLEVIPELYDAAGRRSYKPHLKKGLPPPSFPFGRYVARPLQINCVSLQELRTFLTGCKQASDKETFGKSDYWLPPDEFEKTRQGDCDEFALWTWRQLMQMGYKSRFVAGLFGRYRAGHAWVTFEYQGKAYIADGTRAPLGMNLPRLQTLKYHPIYSVEWDGKNILFYSHAKTTPQIGFIQLVFNWPEWFLFWLTFWAKNIHRLPWIAFRYVKRRLSTGAQ